MSLFSPRLPHVLPRRALIPLLAPTYAAARGVDEEEAAVRLDQALAVPAALADVHEGLSAALREAQGPRTREDALMDRLSAGAVALGGRARPVEATPAVAAAPDPARPGDRPGRRGHARHAPDAEGPRPPGGGAAGPRCTPGEGAAPGRQAAQGRLSRPRRYQVVLRLQSLSGLASVMVADCVAAS
ncbi:MAG: hypothetical protein QM767_25545 [Anaeromyxobacter sp.]